VRVDHHHPQRRPDRLDEGPAHLARDPRLTNGARGLALQLLSHADGYRSDEEFLAQHTADGRDAVRRQLAELRRYGYLVRERVRGEDGKVTTRSVLYDTPQTTDADADGRSPTRGKPASRSDQGRFTKPEPSPDAGNPRDGTTRGNAVKPQVAPTRGVSASRSEQAEQGMPAGRADSRETRVHIEDQGEEQKKISQSAQAREASRWLRGRYGLTDTEADVVIREARLRAPKRINHLVRYLEGMVERGDLADIVGALQAASSTTPEPGPAPERAPRPPVQLPMLQAVPDPEPRADTRSRAEVIADLRREKGWRTAT
jgi:hypothetical protein